MNEGLAGFLPFIIIFVLFYFMLLRPQMKQAKEHKALLDALKAGDEIVSNSGILGKIIKINNISSRKSMRTTKGYGNGCRRRSGTDSYS